MLNKNAQAITALYGEKYSSINAVHLYFDLEDTEKWNENDIENLLKSLAETKFIDNEIKFWIDAEQSANNANNKARAQVYWNKAMQLLPTYVTSLQNVIDCLERNKKASYGIVQSIKKQLKRY